MYLLTEATEEILKLSTSDVFLKVQEVNREAYRVQRKQKELETSSVTPRSPRGCSRRRYPL